MTIQLQFSIVCVISYAMWCSKTHVETLDYPNPNAFHNFQCPKQSICDSCSVSGCTFHCAGELHYSLFGECYNNLVPRLWPISYLFIGLHWTICSYCYSNFWTSKNSKCELFDTLIIIESNTHYSASFQQNEASCGNNAPSYRNERICCIYVTNCITSLLCFIPYSAAVTCTVFHPDEYQLNLLPELKSKLILLLGPGIGLLLSIAMSLVYIFIIGHSNQNMYCLAHLGSVTNMHQIKRDENDKLSNV